MSNRICFVSNFYLTELYEKIAIELKKNGHEIYWICSNENAYKNLTATWGTNNVLYIGMGRVMEDCNDNYPSSLSNIVVNDLIIRDRILKHRSLEASTYLHNLKYSFYKFINNNNIDSVFGELTWSHEVLFNRICLYVEDVNANYYNPHTLRIPQQTFGFFLDEKQSNLSQHKRDDLISDEMRDRYYSTILETKSELPEPDYLRLNDVIVKKSNGLVSQFYKLINLTFRSTDKEDPTLEVSKYRRLSVGAMKFVRAKLYSLVSKTLFDEIKGKKYYIYPLHKQPEASIDVIGKYYDDQKINIRNIASQLKHDQYLVVKEHSNAIGDRSVGFYRQIKNYPRVLLIDDSVNMKQLIAESIGVYTVSGTAALEASLLGKDSYCFSKVYFRGLDHCHITTLESFDTDQYNSGEKGNQSKREFVEEMLKSACKGIISNPRSDERCIHPDNIKSLAREFNDLIAK